MIEKLFQKQVRGFQQGIQTLKNNKSTSLQPSAFISFLVFAMETPMKLLHSFLK